MGFFGKNKKEEAEKQKKEEGKKKEFKEQASQLPELPSLPDLPLERKLPIDIGEEERFFVPSTSSALPSFPHSKLGEKISQGTIKKAIDEESERIPLLPEEIAEPFSREMPKRSMAGRFNYVSLPEEPKNVKEERRTLEIFESQRFKPMSAKQLRIKKAEPLFIQLDTFEKSIASFNEIKLRVNEIESLLKNIKEIKTKEDRELTEWEREIQIIKARLEKIDEDIFSKLE